MIGGLHPWVVTRQSSGKYSKYKVFSIQLLSVYYAGTVFLGNCHIWNTPTVLVWTIKFGENGLGLNKYTSEVIDRFEAGGNGLVREWQWEDTCSSTPMSNTMLIEGEILTETVYYFELAGGFFCLFGFFAFLYTVLLVCAGSSNAVSKHLETRSQDLPREQKVTTWQSYTNN